jgi:hypothetical protein
VIAEADVAVVIGNRLFETAPALQLGVEPANLDTPAHRHGRFPLLPTVIGMASWVPEYPIVGVSDRPKGRNLAARGAGCRGW